MRILLIADIHSNWAALSAIDETFDACLFMGDLVDYATDPIPCIDWMQHYASATVRGNHDHAVAERIPARAGSGYRDLAHATRPLHWKRLNPLRIKYLARMPLTQTISLGEHRFYMVHGTPRDPLDEYLTDDIAAWEKRLEDLQVDFACVGHTHVPFHTDLGGTQLINPGSVGQPRDGDPRAAYAIIENGKVEFHRVKYDIDAALEQMRRAGTEEWAVELAESILRTGGSDVIPSRRPKE